jgi:anti-sigma factor RsiW
MSPNQENFEKLEAYIDGALEAADRAEVERQLAANPQLRKMVAELSMTRDLLRALPRAAAPADLMETFQGSLERTALLGESGPDAAEAVAPLPLRIHRWPQFMSIAAIVLLAVGLGLLVYRIMPQQRSPKMVATSQAPPTSGEPGMATGDGAAPVPLAREMKDGAAATRSDADALAGGGRRTGEERLKEDGVRQGDEYASKAGAGGAGGGIMSKSAAGGDAVARDFRKGGSVEDQALGAPRLNDSAAKQVDEKADPGGNELVRGGRVPGDMRVVQRQVAQPGTDNVGLKAAGGPDGSLDTLRAGMPVQQQLEQNKLADAGQQQLQPQERREVLLVNAKDPQLARQDVSEFLTKNKVFYVAVTDGPELGATTFNYGANLSLANNDTGAVTAAGPTTNGTTLNASAGTLGSNTVAAAPAAPASVASNSTSNSTAPAGGNYGGANYGNSANGNNANVDRSAALNGSGGYAQNGAVARSSPAPAPAQQQQQQQQHQQEMQQRAYSQQPSQSAGQGVAPEGNNTFTFQATQPQSGATVPPQAPATSYSLNGGAYRALLTTRQQEELNRFLSRRGDQWAEQHEVPPYLYARLQAIDTAAAQKQESLQQQVRESLATGAAADQPNDESKKADKPGAAADTVARMKAQAKPDQQAVARAAQPDVQLRAQRSVEAGAEAQVRMRSAQEHELARRSAVNAEGSAPAARGGATARPEGDAARGSTTPEDAEAGRRFTAKALAPSATQPVPALQAPSARGMNEARDKNGGEANFGEDAHEVIIVFNEQPLRLPTTIATTAPGVGAAAATPATQPAGVPAATQAPQQSKP